MAKSLMLSLDWKNIDTGEPFLDENQLGKKAVQIRNAESVSFDSTTLDQLLKEKKEWDEHPEMNFRGAMLLFVLGLVILCSFVFFGYLVMRY